MDRILGGHSSSVMLSVNLEVIPKEFLFPLLARQILVLQ